jgi:hypothetical protein
MQIFGRSQIRISKQIQNTNDPMLTKDKNYRPVRTTPPKEKDGLGFGFVYYDLSGNRSHGEEPQLFRRSDQ